MPKRTRKQQIDGFIHQVHAGKSSVEIAMQSACFVGACEERDHCLGILDGLIPILSQLESLLLADIRNSITRKSVLEVLGYEPKPKPKKKA